MTITKTLAVAAFTLVTATGAFAKGHDQGGGPNGSPATTSGANAGEETASAAQGLGSALGNGKDQSGKDRGKSGEANSRD